MRKALTLHLLICCIAPLFAAESRAQPPRARTTGGVKLSRPAQITLVSAAEPYAGLQRQFRRQQGWTGGDGAATVSLSAEKTLWLFGDTFIGAVVDGTRPAAAFINNSAAWQNPAERRAPLQFFWATAAGKAQALLAPRRPGEFYWPCDGQMLDGKLYLFMRAVRLKKESGGPFDFDITGCDLVVVENPLAEPTKWQYNAFPLALNQQGFDAISACTKDANWLYVYGRVMAKGSQTTASIAIARIAISSLQAADYGNWQYLCATAQGASWQKQMTNAQIMFADGAPEMSVGRIPGVKGLVATYMPAFSDTIYVRVADAAEGPWSERLVVYKCPPHAAHVFLYSARAHAELARPGANLIITYCRNSQRNEDHKKIPALYVPQAVAVDLRQNAPVPMKKR